MAEPTEASSSASLSAYYNYDVFLSFRGTDTRNSFTGFLHKALKKEGIDVFIDSENLWGGELIGPALIRAIEGSKISIPVFSNGYASSKWCLLELSQILKRHKSNGQVVLPIFLDVEPSDVRHQTGSFEGPFQEHEKKFTSVTVESWREALRVVGSLKGWVLNKDTNGDQATLVESVVKMVLSELNSSMHLVACKYPIGIDSQVKELIHLLNNDSNDVQFIGICGLGGIGKSTIAKAVYNHLLSNFNQHSFLSNIREQAMQPKGLESLQLQLLKDISKRDKKDIDINDYERGKVLIKQRLCKEKVLVVLDNVDHKRQLDALAGELNWFGQGSRVIITTRDACILDMPKIDKDKIYWPPELNTEDSLHLFSLFAFSKDQPPDDYLQLSKLVVSNSGGLPLAIEVLGSYLSSIRDKGVWESTIQKWKEIPNLEIQERLKISYDSLEDKYQKSIFLDSACFFIGWEKETVISIWEACGYHPKAAIHILIERSLLKFQHDKYLRMHDLIRDMGRSIVLEENHKEPSKRSRLWSHDDILQLLEGHKGTGKIEGMVVPIGLQRDPLTNEHFAMMSNLRFLDISSTHFRGDFSLLPHMLSWFRWKSCPLNILPANFYHKRLVNLDLSCSMIYEAWNIRSQDEIKVFQNLKVLVLGECKYLAKSPDFSWFPQLEQLDLRKCKSLDKLDESIGQLSKLKNLILKDCDSLKKLPDSIGDLKSLVQLDLSCSEIEELPDNISKLSSLSYCRSVKKLPDSIGDLKSLVQLDLSWSEIEELPDNISKLSSLKELILSNCRSLKKLPDSIGDQKSLVQLDLSWSEIEELPDNIPKLSFLEELILSNCKSLKKLPESFGDLESLVKLHCKGCFSLVRLPDLSRLRNLAILHLEGCMKLREIRGLDRILSLVEFNAHGCHNLTVPLRKIHGQGTLLLERPLEKYSLTTIDGIYDKQLILCLVLELPSDFRLQTIYCDISASICQGEKTTSCVHTLRIDDVEFTTHTHTLYLHYFKKFEWFGIPLHGKETIDNLYSHQSQLSHQLSCDGDVSRPNFRVKFWKLLFENREPDQQEPNRHSIAMMVADFFNWSFGGSREADQQEPDRRSSAMIEADFSNWLFENREHEHEQKMLNQHSSAMIEADFSNWLFENREHEHEQKMLNQHSSAMMVAELFGCSYDGEPSLKACNVGVRASNSNVPEEAVLTAIERLFDEDEAGPSQVEEALLRATVRPVLDEDDEAAFHLPLKRQRQRQRKQLCLFPTKWGRLYESMRQRQRQRKRKRKRQG